MWGDAMARKSEIDLSRYDWTKAKRGKYAARARRSFATISVDRKVLRAVADAIGETKPRRRRAT
jgi:hypothetical protein